MFLSPKGSMDTSYRKNCQEFKYVSLTNVNVEVTSQCQLEVIRNTTNYEHIKISHHKTFHITTAYNISESSNHLNVVLDHWN